MATKWNSKEAKEQLEQAVKTRNRFIGGKVRVDVYKNNMAIFEDWCYETENGKIVGLPNKQQMLDATKVYREAFTVAEIAAEPGKTEVYAVDEDAMVEGKRLIDRGLNPAILNLADAYHACGKYNGGANAQEESLCRATTLSQCLYQYFNKTWAGKAGVELRPQSAYPMDINFGGIYSKVTCFRHGPKEGYALMDAPFDTAIISVAALNFREGHKTANLQYRSADGGFTPEGDVVMRNKMRTIYRIALSNGHDSVVLGAFGCGVFCLIPELVAQMFLEVLQEPEFKNKFKTVAFAILGEKNCKPFINMIENQ